MELNTFALSLLENGDLESKLFFPHELSDSKTKASNFKLNEPSRSDAIKMFRGKKKASLPTLNDLEHDHERARLLHFFANHELLAIELMALSLLKFQDAPKSFRQGLVQTIAEEQKHLGLYLDRMSDLQCAFGDHELNDFFWHSMSNMQSPKDYVCQMSLSFEQANLDYAALYQKAFLEIGDQKTASILDEVLKDEIGHVGFGLVWFRRWKERHLTDWQAFRNHLVFPFSPSRAKGLMRGKGFNRRARVEAGFDEDFIMNLESSHQSKGRPPRLFVFNADCEMHRAYPNQYQSNKAVRELDRDLTYLPFALAHADDMLLTRSTPSMTFLSHLNRAGLFPCEWLDIEDKESLEGCHVNHIHIASLHPWGQAPDSEKLFKAIIPKLPEPNDKVDYDHLNQISKKSSLPALREKLLLDLKDKEVENRCFSESVLGRTCKKYSKL